MGTNYKAPMWRMPENANKDKLSNYSIDFTKSNEYIDLPETSSIRPTSAKMSLSAWFNISGGSGDRTIFAIGISGGYAVDYQLNINTNNNLTFRVRTTGSSPHYTSITGGTTLNTNQWYHACVTWDGSNINLYLDGQADATQVAATTFYYTGSASLPGIASQRGGSSGSGHAAQWTGSLSQICYFDYALTDGTSGTTNQISYLYNLNNPMIPGTVNLTAPVAYWPLGDNSNPNTTAGYPNISVGADSVFEFTQSNSYPQTVDFGNPFSTSNKITFAIWFNTTTTIGGDTGYTILSRGSVSSVNGCFLLMVRNNNEFQCWFYDDSGTSPNPVLGSGTNFTNYNDGNWHHIAITIDGTLAQPALKMYLDGVLASSATSPNTGINQPAASVNQLLLGQRQYTYSALGAKYSNLCTFDDVLELTGTQSITSLYNNGTPPDISNYNNLTGWWKLNQSANWEADAANTWQIPDNRSSFLTSFNFSQNKTITTPYVFSDIITGSNKMAVCTISYWYKTPNVTGSHEDYMSLNNFPSNLSAKFRVDSSNRFYYLERSNYLRFVAQTNLDEWNHHCWVFNSATSYDGTVGQTDGDLQFYVNGVAQAVDYNNVATPANNPWTFFNIAKADQSSGSGLDFEMSNLQLYNTNFSASQVLQLYNNGVPLPTNSVATNNLKAWYKLDNTDSFNNNSSAWNIFNNKYSIPTPNYTKALSKTGYGGNYLNFRTTTSLTTNDELTSSFWIKTTQTGNYGIASGTVGAGPFTFSTNRIFIIRGPNNYRYFPVDQTGVINDGNWHHILVYSPGYDRLDINSVRLFIDGIEAGAGGSGHTNANPTYEVGSSLGYIGSSGYYNGNGTLVASNVAVWAGDKTGDIAEIYNGGTPALSYTSTPTYWFKLTDISTSAGGGWYDSSGNGNTVSGVTNNPTVVDSNVVAREYAISSGMTQQNLVNNNVSALNGESSGINTSNLVQSNIGRTQPFSSYSVEFDGLNHFGGNNTAFNDFQLQQLSYSIWFRRTGSLTSNVCLMTRGMSSNKGWTLWLNNATVIAQFADGSNDSYNNSKVTSYKTYIPDNTWGNIVATYDGANQKIYLNGQLRNTYSTTAAIDYGVTSLFFIGQRDTGASNFYGQISNPAIWNQALTADDVLNIYNNGIPQDLSNFRITPLAWWELGDNYTYWNGSDLIARSTSSANYDATGTNTSRDQLVGNAPGSEANGTGSNLTIDDFNGDMKNSVNNSHSINMADYASGVTNPANSGRSTETPIIP